MSRKTYVILDGNLCRERISMLVIEEMYQECIDDGGSAADFFIGKGIADAKKTGTVELPDILDEVYTTQGC